MKSHTRLAKKLDKKRVIICLLVFFTLMPIFSYLHEAGHALVCIADGNEAEISVDILSGGLTFCYGEVSNLFAYKISGGLLAGIIGTTIAIALFVWKPFAGYSLESTRYNSWEIDGKVERIESRKRRYLDIIWKAPFIALTTIGIALFVWKPFAGYSLESTNYNLWEIDGKVERVESRKQRCLDIVWKAPFIVLTTIGVGHLVNAVIEAFADSYFTHGTEWSLFLGLVEFVIFFSLLIIFDRK